MLQEVKDKAFVSAWYEEKIRQFGDDPRSLGFNQLSSQQKRFEEFLHLGEFKGKSVLDVGCGRGDFLHFLRERGIPVRYTGIDLTPAMVQQCKNRFRDYLGRECHFETTDTLEFEPAAPYDFVVSSGMFGLSSPRSRDRIAPTLDKLYSWCREGAAVNFLSQQAKTQNAECMYVDPAEILKLALRISPAVRFAHDYLPNDFTIYMYRTPRWLENVPTTAGNGHSNGRALPL